MKPQILPFIDTDFKKAFQKISALKTFSPYLTQIIQLIKKGEINQQNMGSVLAQYHIQEVTSIKEETLNLLLVYIGFILDDGIITHKELGNLKILKRLFKIREGDFYNHRHDEIQKLLNRQFEVIYQDNLIDKSEALLKVGLQELFDLGYDQFLELSEGEIKKALNRGADLDNLDTVRKIPN